MEGIFSGEITEPMFGGKNEHSTCKGWKAGLNGIETPYGRRDSHLGMLQWDSVPGGLECLG